MKHRRAVVYGVSAPFLTNRADGQGRGTSVTFGEMSNRSSFDPAGLLILAGAMLGGFVGAYMTNGAFWGIMAGVMAGLIFGTAAIGLAIIFLGCAFIAAFIYAIQHAKSPIFFVVVVIGFGVVVALRVLRKGRSGSPQEAEYTPVVTKRIVSNVNSMLGSGMTVKEVAAAMELSTSTVYRIKNQKYDVATLPDR